ncbi:MAG: SsrA-binding protein [Omnitrophica WOR_2 bacterium RIFCSPHIGHO2_02_FULL_45_21]|nr:MAG: SsrA-binding protein [Omnitrophica WOR_2 bacterium RIFCSPHIGHO2_02_FULL_45_21]
MERIDVAANRKAFRDYEILERFEAGIVLVGSEVKSLRAFKANLTDSFARIEENEISLYNMDVAAYAQASYMNVEPKRVRRLLLHQKEIQRLKDKAAQRGFTLVPLKLYFNQRGIAKLELALARGKKFYDRREDIKRREADLKIRKTLKSRRK